MARTSAEQQARELILGNKKTESVVDSCIEVVKRSPLSKTQQRNVLTKITQVGAASLELSRLDAEIKTANDELRATDQHKHVKQLQTQRKQLQAAQAGMNQQIIGIMEALKTPALAARTNGEAV